MWPDDWKVWIPNACAFALGETRHMLRSYVVLRDFVEVICGPVIEAVRDDLDLLRAQPRFFARERECRFWARAVARPRALTLAVRHAPIRWWLRGVPDAEYRVLWWCYADRLSLSAIAHLLRPPGGAELTQAQARERVRHAYAALRTHLSNELVGELYLFPEPEQLQAFAAPLPAGDP